MNIAINEDCSFSIITNKGALANGTITDLNGPTYTGAGQTDSAGCGSFTVSKEVSGTLLAGSYQYGNGKTGSIPNATSGGCKSANFLNTEMLAGSLRFTYTFGSYYQDDVYLNLNSAGPSPSEANAFILSGYGVFDFPAIGGYSPSGGIHEVLVAWSTFYHYFAFNFIGNGSISGCYYFIDKSDGSLSSCSPMTGSRLSH